MYIKKSHLAKELIENNKLLQNLTPRLKSNKYFNYCQLYLNKHANEMSRSGHISAVYWADLIITGGLVWGFVSSPPFYPYLLSSPDWAPWRRMG